MICRTVAAVATTLTRLDVVVDGDDDDERETACM